MRYLMVLFAALFSCGKHDNAARPVEKPLMEAVYASGYVVAKNEYQIFAQVDGYLTEQLVREGDAIKTGQPIFVIEGNQQSARSAIAKETYDLAKRNVQSGSSVLAELQASISSAQTKMGFDSVNLIRYTNLLSQKATTQLEYDRAKLTYQNSRNDYKLQLNRYVSRKNQLKLDYENSQRQMDITNEEAGRYVIKSEIDGRLFSTTKEKGELVRRGEVLAVAGDARGFYLKLAVDEMDVKKIKEGQEVLVKIDAFGDEIFKASIVHIYPIIDMREQAIRVDADFEKISEGLYSGLAVEANIVIRQKSKAMVIPRKYLLAGDSVLIEGTDGTRKVKIKKGIETLDEVEVLGGLNTTTELLLK